MCFFKIRHKYHASTPSLIHPKKGKKRHHQSSQEIIVFETFEERVLREQCERLNPVSIDQNSAEERKKLQRSKPLELQIREYIDSLPPFLRESPITMAEIVNQLTGRYRDRPHAQHVGAALRSLGYRPKRLWGRMGEGRRVWILS